MLPWFRPFPPRTGLVIADTMRETFGYTWAFPHASDTDAELIPPFPRERFNWRYVSTLLNTFFDGKKAGN